MSSVSTIRSAMFCSLQFLDSGSSLVKKKRSRDVRASFTHLNTATNVCLKLIRLHAIIVAFLDLGTSIFDFTSE